MTDANSGADLGAVGRRIVRAMLVVAFYWVFLKVGGLLMNLLIVNYFGEGPLYDAFTATYNVLVYLLVFSSLLKVVLPAYMPLFADRIAEGEEGAWAFTNTVANLALPATGMLLLVAMFVGGMSGSTGGSIKVVRVWVLWRGAYRQINRLIHPRAVMPIKGDDRVVPDEIVQSIFGFFLLYILIFVASAAALGVMGLDLTTSLSAAAACVGNVGPGLGAVGPTQNYGFIPDAGKWLLSFDMVVGRLELYTILVLLIPGFWRR